MSKGTSELTRLKPRAYPRRRASDYPIKGALHAQKRSEIWQAVRPVKASELKLI